MLYFVSPELALGYWFFAFCSALGALQWIAARYRLRGIALIGGGRNTRRGYGVGAVLVLGGAATFFVGQWEAILTPGPAGAELAVLFATAAACALAVAIASAAVQEHWHSRDRAPTGQEERTAKSDLAAAESKDQGTLITVGHAVGRLYSPPWPTASAPAVCILPGLGASSDRAIAALACSLSREGTVALVIQPDDACYAYPAVLAIVPAAVTALSKRPEVDPTRIALLGEDLGADLAIRAAATCREIRAVAALAPVLGQVPIGMDLLREMTYCRALRWARDRRRAALRQELNTAEYADRLSPRPLLVLYGEEDRLANSAAAAEWRARYGDSMQFVNIQKTGHLDLLENAKAWQVVQQWLKEHLQIRGA